MRYLTGVPLFFMALMPAWAEVTQQYQMLTKWDAECPTECAVGGPVIDQKAFENCLVTLRENWGACHIVGKMTLDGTYDISPCSTPSKSDVYVSIKHVPIYINGSVVLWDLAKSPVQTVTYTYGEELKNGCTYAVVPNKEPTLGGECWADSTATLGTDRYSAEVKAMNITLPMADYNYTSVLVTNGGNECINLVKANYTGVTFDISTQGLVPNSSTSNIFSSSLLLAVLGVCSIIY